MIVESTKTHLYPLSTSSIYSRIVLLVLCSSYIFLFLDWNAHVHVICCGHLNLAWYGLLLLRFRLALILDSKIQTSISQTQTSIDIMILKNFDDSVMYFLIGDISTYLKIFRKSDPTLKQAHQAATILLFGLKFNFRTRDISVGFRKRDSLQLSGMDSFFSGHSLSSFHWEVLDSFSFWMSPKEKKNSS